MAIDIKRIVSAYTDRGFALASSRAESSKHAARADDYRDRFLKLRDELAEVREKSMWHAGTDKKLEFEAKVNANLRIHIQRQDKEIAKLRGESEKSFDDYARGVHDLIRAVKSITDSVEDYDLRQTVNRASKILIDQGKLKV